MVNALIVFLIIGVVVVGIFIHPILVARRRHRLKRRPFPPQWAALIEHNVPTYTCLTPAERKRWQGHIQVFLAEKQFIGCGGLQVTEEMTLTIAAIACLLLLNERGQYFPHLRSILIYPNAYWVNQSRSPDGYVVEEERVARLGESWTRDQVILTWAQIKHDTQNWQDGRNVVLHEFAHQLDQEDGNAEGVPILRQKTDYETWATVMVEGYQQLCQDIERGRKTTIDRYGATNPAEFFAVVTEMFFEHPRQMQLDHSPIYAVLQNYYQLDPMQWK